MLLRMTQWRHPVRWNKKQPFSAKLRCFKSPQLPPSSPSYGIFNCKIYHICVPHPSKGRMRGCLYIQTGVSRGFYPLAWITNREANHMICHQFTSTPEPLYISILKTLPHEKSRDQKLQIQTHYFSRGRRERTSFT
jgi:hypothetical protein